MAASVIPEVLLEAALLFFSWLGKGPTVFLIEICSFFAGFEDNVFADTAVAAKTNKSHRIMPPVFQSEVSVTKRFGNGFHQAFDGI